ncbi:hypothetical protein Chor_013052 [Crotalus horridus]
MARSTALHFRVVEGRDLPAKDVSGTSDPYCIIKVDNEIVARHDDVIGKISLSKDEISSQPRGIDSWINLSQVDPNEEVQGEISLELQVVEEGHQRLLCCHVLEARDLAPRDLSGTSDPFARILFNGQILETAIIKKTRFPRWEEMLEFALEEGADSETPLVVEVWDWDMVGKNDFLGQVKFCLGSVQKTILKGWFRLLPLPNAGEDTGGKLGQLRLQVQLAEDRILPSSYYQPLVDLLVESVLCLPEFYFSINILNQMIELKAFFNIKKANIADPNTLFRSNSLASKSMEQFMKIVGMPYLHEVLKVIIHRIFDEKKRISFKGSLSEAQIRESSLEVLKGYLGDIVDAIVGSTESCPSLMRAVQSIGNLGLQLGHGKEQWMQPLHPFILASIGQGSEKQPWTLFHSSAIIKEGYLQKRKAESVHLVSQAIAGPVACKWTVPVIRRSMVESQSWKEAPDMMEERLIPVKDSPEVLEVLGFEESLEVLGFEGLATCDCDLVTVRGCSRTHSAVTLRDWSDPLDPDAEAQMVYKQLLLHKDKLREKYQEIANTEAAQEQSNTAKKASDKNQQRLTAAAHLLEVIQGLEQAHKAFEHQEDGEKPGTGALPPP